MNLTDLTNAFLRCRTFGHAWDDFRETGKTREADLTLRCTRCTTTRYDVIDEIGGVTKRTYDYPTGYRTARLERSDLRLELLRRLRRRK